MLALSLDRDSTDCLMEYKDLPRSLSVIVTVNWLGSMVTLPAVGLTTLSLSMRSSVSSAISSSSTLNVKQGVCAEEVTLSLTGKSVTKSLGSARKGCLETCNRLHLSQVVIYIQGIPADPPTGSI